MAKPVGKLTAHMSYDISDKSGTHRKAMKKVKKLYTKARRRDLIRSMKAELRAAELQFYLEDNYYLFED